MSTSTKQKQPSRTWVLVISLGTPLAIVVAAAFVASFRALTDVGIVNGVQPAWLLPVVVDVGMITTNIASVLFRTRGLSGRWWANTMFGMFAAVSVFANVSHAQLAADFTRTTLLQAMVIAALFPVAQLGLTHLVMMLIPDEKERAKLQLQRERTMATPQQPSISEHRPEPQIVSQVSTPQTVPAEREPLRLVGGATQVKAAEAEVAERVREHIAVRGKKPTGAMVGEWLGGKSAKTGQRFLLMLDAETPATTALAAMEG